MEPYAKGEQRVYITPDKGVEERVRFVEELNDRLPGSYQVVTLYDGSERVIPVKPEEMSLSLRMLNTTAAEEFMKRFLATKFDLRWERQAASCEGSENTYYMDCFLENQALTGMSGWAEEEVTVLVGNVSATAPFPYFIIGTTAIGAGRIA